MWWGGLKGGLAIAVVLSIPSDLPERQFLFEITLGVVLFTLLISAPTIRPLMHFLGLSEFSRGEELEYRNSLLGAEGSSQNYLSMLASSKIVPRRTVAPLQEQIHQTFFSGIEDDDKLHEDDEYFAEFRAYKVERESLKSLYETGVISQYIYLDMNNRLHAVQESLRLGEAVIGEVDESEELTLFQKLEIFILGKIREKSWLAGWLSKYQEQRTVHRVQRNLAHILACDAVISMLGRQDDLLEEARNNLISTYEDRKKYYRKQLKQIRKYYPKYYLQFLERLTTRSIINSGWNRMKSEFSHGDLSAKGFNLIQDRVAQVLAEVDESPLIFSKTVSTISEYLEEIDMFQDLTDRDYQFLEENASIVTFLAGDTIMGRFEKGEDFYILVDGKATVWIKDAFSREQFMAEFLKGDFMGESGLLAKQKNRKHHRSATIKAETPCTLIRVSPHTMSRILWKYPRILETIREINEARLSVRPKSTDKLRVYKPSKGHK